MAFGFRPRQTINKTSKRWHFKYETNLPQLYGLPLPNGGKIRMRGPNNAWEYFTSTSNGTFGFLAYPRIFNVNRRKSMPLYVGLMDRRVSYAAVQGTSRLFSLWSWHLNGFPNLFSFEPLRSLFIFIKFCHVVINLFYLKIYNTCGLFFFASDAL